MMPLSLLIAFLALWIIRQSIHDNNGYGWSFRLFLGGLAASHLFGVIYGRIAEVLIVQDAAIFGLLLTVMLFHRHRFNRW